MQSLQIEKSILTGKISASPSKSHTLRAILFATMAEGISTISNYLHSPDAEAMVTACRQMGADITVTAEQINITGIGGKPKTVDDIIDCGNSGQVLRFVSAMTALNSSYTIFTGDYSIRHNRPMLPLINGLTALGAFCVSARNDGFAPIIVRGPMEAGEVIIDGEDSQPVSALLMACCFLNSRTDIYVKNAGEKPWIDLTLSWLDKFKLPYENHDYAHYIIYGDAKYQGFDYAVVGDFSSILFPLVAALITQTEIALHYVDMDDVQGDKQVIAVLKQMGANIEYDRKKQILTVKKTAKLIGREIDVNAFIDAVPILAVVGCYAQGTTKLTNAKIARSKECDRLACITKELRKMGANLEETIDSLTIESMPLNGASVVSHHDHRIAMALCVAALGATGKTLVADTECIAKSYPTFYPDMKKLGVKITTIC
jgi:3-phosphoshikimate 1-carboxyvinyltransferase